MSLEKFKEESNNNLILFENDKLSNIQKEINVIKQLILENKSDIIKNYIKSLDLTTKKYFAENDLFIEYLYDNSNNEIKKILINKSYNPINFIDKNNLSSDLLLHLLESMNYKDVQKIIEKFQLSYTNFSEECLILAQKQGMQFPLENIIKRENLLLEYLKNNLLNDKEAKYFYENCKFINVHLFLLRNYRISLYEGEYLRLKEIEPEIVSYCLKNQTNFSNILKYEGNDLNVLKNLYDYELNDSSKKELCMKILKHGSIESIKFLIDKGELKIVMDGIKMSLIKEEVLIKINEITTNTLILDELKNSKVKAIQDKVFILSNTETRVFKL